MGNLKYNNKVELYAPSELTWQNVVSLMDITTQQYNIDKELELLSGKIVAKPVTDYTKCYCKESERIEFMGWNVNYRLGKTNFTLDPNMQIKEIKVYVPGKVMGVTIGNHEYKQVVKEPDVFSMEFGCALAMAKCMFGDAFSAEGIEVAAGKLLYFKCVQAEIKRAIRIYNDILKAEERSAKIKEEIEAIKKRRREKAKKKRETRKKKATKHSKK